MRLSRSVWISAASSTFSPRPTLKKKRARLHRGEDLPADQVGVGRPARHNVDEIIRRAHRLAQRVKRDDAVESRLDPRRAAHAGHLHTERLQRRAGRAAAHAGAYDHRRLARDQRPRLAAIPPVFSLIAQQPGCVMAEREHHEEYGLCTRVVWIIAEHERSRRLAAIVAADFAGYLPLRASDRALLV